MESIGVIATCPIGGLVPMTAMSENIGPYPKLGKMVREITGEVQSRVAARRAGISHDTIIRMWNGERPYEATLIRFAMGYGVDPNPLLEAAGYPTLPTKQTPRVVKSEQRALYTTDAIRDAIDEVGTEGEEFERVKEPDADEEEDLKIRIVAAYDKLPFKIKQALTEQAEATADAMYSARKDIVGKKADKLVDTALEE